MVSLFGGAFCVLLAVIAFAQPFLLGIMGTTYMMIDSLMLTGLPAAMFVRQLRRSWRSNRAVCNDPLTTLEGKLARSGTQFPPI
jgi:hypothetical protein